MDEDFSKLLKVDDLKCNICKHYLSVPPIIYTDSTGIICGRCKKYACEKNSKPEIHRQEFFEKIAERMKFPCMYEHMGCEEKLGWKDVEEHEKSCNFKTVTCPYNMVEFIESHQVECNWKGQFDQLMKHAKESHHENFINPAKILLDEQFKSRFIFTECLDQVILVIFLYNEAEDVYTCIVMSDSLRYWGKSLNYQVKIYDEKEICILFPQTSLVNVSLKIERLQMIGYKLDFSKIRSIINPSCIVVNIISEGWLEIKRFVENSITNTNPMETLLKCAGSSCSLNGLTPPIFFCYQKHNKCGNCLEATKDKCCNRKNGRNYAMEKLLHSSHWKCSNSKCSHISLGSKYAIHKKICPYRTRKCLIEDCEWEGDDFKSHLMKTQIETHEISELNQGISLSQGARKLFFIFDGQVFVLEKDFTYEVQGEALQSTAKFKLVCLETVEFLYKYEIEIYCIGPSHSKISYQHLVEPQHLPIVDGKYKQRDLTFSNILNELFPITYDAALSTILRFVVNISRIDE